MKDQTATLYPALSRQRAFAQSLDPAALAQMRAGIGESLPEVLLEPVPIDHFDGLDKFEDLPRDGRCVADYWF